MGDDLDDWVRQIPQQSFREPVRRVLTEVRDRITNIRGLVVFGSVARGEADRMSDIDVFVLVDDDSATKQRIAHEITAEFVERKIEGDRYRPQILVESVGSANRIGDRLYRILDGCVVVVDSEELQSLMDDIL